MSRTEKVCPLVFRARNERTEILVFRHPLAGVQFVKGTVEENEDRATAARRELAEESGITALSGVFYKGTLDFEEIAQCWHFYLCETAAELPDKWVFFANDDGGTDFSFFWFALAAAPTAEWHPVHRKALEYIKGIFGFQ